jgi:hypothetical protein
LVETHFVLYLTLHSNTEGDPLRYNLKIHKFANFAHALWFAEKHLGDRPPCCRDLFRFATPVTTGREGQESDEGDDVYDNVVIDDDDDDDADDTTGALLSACDDTGARDKTH